MESIGSAASGQLWPTAAQSDPQFWSPVDLELLVSDRHLGARFDFSRQINEIYVGDYSNDRIVRHDIDANLIYTQVALPMTYGLPWLAEDLDGDGQFELVVQRGDPGFGGNGYLDIHRSSDWSVRKRFTFASQKGWMYPRAVNLDADTYLELFFTLNNGFGGPCQAAIVKYSPDSGFYLMYRVPVPQVAGGHAAIGDVDNDGTIEFVSGGSQGYSLFEWNNDSLCYIGLIDSTEGNNNGASLFYPKPDSIPRVLIGHSATEEYGFQYEILLATGDNIFQVEDEIVKLTPWGLSTSIAHDVDCDGLDEMVLELWPWSVEYQWDNLTHSYVERCSWNASDSMQAALYEWYVIDLDQNGVPEWATVGGDDTLYVFASSECSGCDSVGQCHPRDPCVCACHADPLCDGIRCDIVDVELVVGVAFRGQPSLYDSDCLFERSDVDCSGATDAVDVVNTVNVAFRGGQPLSAFCDPCE